MLLARVAKTVFLTGLVILFFFLINVVNSCAIIFCALNCIGFL